MKFFAATALFAAVVVAHPLEHRSGNICPTGTLYNNPVCCESLILGVVGLNCQPPSQPYDDGAGFRNACAEQGLSPACCAVPVAGQGVLCQGVIA